MRNLNKTVENLYFDDVQSIEVLMNKVYYKNDKRLIDVVAEVPFMNINKVKNLNVYLYDNEDIIRKETEEKIVIERKKVFFNYAERISNGNMIVRLGFMS